MLIGCGDAYGGAVPGAVCISCAPDKNSMRSTRYSAARFMASCCGVGVAVGLAALLLSDTSASRRHTRADTSKEAMLDCNRCTTGTKSASRDSSGDGAGGTDVLERRHACSCLLKLAPLFDTALPQKEHTAVGTRFPDVDEGESDGGGGRFLGVDGGGGGAAICVCGSACCC